MQGTRGAIRSGGDAGAAASRASRRRRSRSPATPAWSRSAPDGTADGRLRHPGLQRHRAGDGGRVVEGPGRQRHGRRDRARSRRRDRHAAALPARSATSRASTCRSTTSRAPAGDYTLDLDIHGPVVAAGRRAAHDVPARRRRARRRSSIPVTAAGPGARRRRREAHRARTSTVGAELRARRPARHRRARAPHRARRSRPARSLTVSSDLLADILPGTGAVSVSVSPLAALDVPALLQALDRYPYGCSEQIVSRALPLLYVNKLAGDGGAGARHPARRARARRDRARARAPGLERRLRPVVGRRRRHLAQRLRHRLPDPGARARLRGAAARLRPRARPACATTSPTPPRSSRNGADLAYAVYVLARNGRPVMGDLRYLADTKLAAFRTPLARAQIGAALGAARRPRALAERVRRRRSSSCAARATPASIAADYGTRLRDGAGMLALVSEAGLARETIQPIARVIEEERGVEPHDEHAGERLDGARRRGARPRRRGDRAHGRRRAAQGLALPHLPRRGARARAGDACRTPAPPRRRSSSTSPATRSSRSPRPRRATRSSGPTTSSTARRSIRRRCARTTGSSPSLKVTEAAARTARVLLVDRLPAGFEIDNPKLVDGDAVGGARLARDGGRAGPHRVPRRPLRRGVRPRHRTSRRSSPSPTWCGRSRPGATSTRRPWSRTCTAPSASAAPPSARSR